MKILGPRALWASGMREFLYGGSDLPAPVAPYLRDGVSIQRYLAMPVLAGLLVTLGAIYFFGWHVLAVLFTALLAGAVVALAFSAIQKRPLVGGLFGVVLFYSLLLPANLPLWMVALGAAVAIFSREIFGAFKNIFHPALVGKAFLLVLFPTAMSRAMAPFWGGWGGFLAWAPSQESLTPLVALRQGQGQGVGAGTPELWQLFMGNVPGALGTTSGLLLLIAGGWLLLTRAVDWRISLVMIATVAVGESLLEMLFPTVFGGGALLHLFTGGLLFTAFLIATDPVTSPMTPAGKWLYASALGLLVLLLRGLTADPEGVTFSVLLMNAFVPLIDKLTVPKSFGGRP